MERPASVTTILNFRDVGETVNDFVGKRRLRDGRLYRAARLDDCSLEDQRIIRDELGIQTVIDLRTKTEHDNQLRKREADLKVPALLQSNAVLAEPLKIKGLKYHEIRLTGRNFEKFLTSQLSWWDYLCLVFLFLFGYRNEAISIMSREVMLPRGLVGMGLATLDYSGSEIAAALRAIVEPLALPVLVHCTQGKDRTGLVVALVLMILEVPLEAIEHDYALTDAALAVDREERLREIREIGLTDDWGVTDRRLIRAMHEHLEEKYGGLAQYLDAIGFRKQDRLAMRELLLR